MKKYTYIDLFAGAGGMSLGFDNAGFKNLLSVEFNKDFAETYKKNFPNHNLMVRDIKEISNEELADMLVEMMATAKEAETVKVYTHKM